MPTFTTGSTIDPAIVTEIIWRYSDPLGPTITWVLMRVRRMFRV
jgi:hypothetical protein